MVRPVMLQDQSLKPKTDKVQLSDVAMQHAVEAAQRREIEIQLMLLQDWISEQLLVMP